MRRLVGSALAEVLSFSHAKENRNMASASLAELSQASFNALLSATTAEVISYRLEGQPLDPRQSKVLREAADLLQRIREGATFVENGQMTGHARPQEALEEYDCAFSALRALNLLGADVILSQLLDNFRNDLLSLAQGVAAQSPNLAGMRNFFDALSDLFFSDVRRPIVGREWTASES